MEITPEQKLSALLTTEYKDTALTLIDALYQKATSSIYNISVLALINKILSEIGYKQIDKLIEFNVVLSDLVEVDSQKLVNNNLKLFENLNIDLEKDMLFSKKKTQHRYIVRIINTVVAKVNYKLLRYRSCTHKNSVKISVIRCKLIP